MIDVDRDFDAAMDQAIVCLVSEISQLRWYAGWQSNIEHHLWDEMHAVAQPTGPWLGNGDYNQGDEALTAALFAVANAVRRWPIWSDDSDPAPHCVSFEEFDQLHRARS